MQEQVLSFYHMGFRDGTRVVRLGSKCLSLLSHLTILHSALLTPDTWEDFPTNQSFLHYTLVRDPFSQV